MMAVTAGMIAVTAIVAWLVVYLAGGELVLAINREKRQGNGLREGKRRLPRS